VTSELAPVRRWLVLAAVITLALGAGVAVVLGRRLARPLVAAERATSRIAAGDLTTRLPETAGDDELVRLTRAINQLAGSLERSRRLEQQFLLSVSHDLRTPLTSIRGYADALADGTLTDVGRGAAVIQREAARLERLVRDLLDLARLDAHQFRLHLDVVDLADVARRAVEAFGPDAEREGIRLALREPAEDAGAVPVVADGDRLAQVVANLVENALKFAAGRIEVAVGSGEGWAWLVVGDDGPGIAAEDLPHVFERLFVAGGRPARHESGAGLGLAIARELVVAQGGTVSAGPRAAAEGGGTQMVVRLPLAPAPTGPAAAGPAAAGTGAGAAAAEGKDAAGPSTGAAAAPGPSASAGAAAPPGPGPDRRPTPP
jgi:two-component system sensor histidine kinase BaeS